MAYIYKLTNNINGKIYIGLTSFPEVRLKQHIKLSENPKNPIHFAIAKYGIENFSFKIIEETENPSEREIYWIKFYNTYKGDGYNTTAGGEGNRRLDRDQILSDYDELKIIKLVAERNDCDPSSVSKILDAEGVRKRKTMIDREKIISDFLKLGTIKATAELNECDVQLVSRVLKKAEIKVNHNSYATKVNMLDKKTKEIIKIFDSQTDAAKFLQENRYSETKSTKILSARIGHVCKGERKTCGGFSWSFAQ